MDQSCKHGNFRRIVTHRRGLEQAPRERSEPERPHYRSYGPYGNRHRFQRYFMPHGLDRSSGCGGSNRCRRQRFAQPSRTVHSWLELNRRGNRSEPRFRNLAKHGLERILADDRLFELQFRIFPLRRLHGQIHFIVPRQPFYRILEQSVRPDRHQMGHLGNPSRERRTPLLREELNRQRVNFPVRRIKSPRFPEGFFLVREIKTPTTSPLPESRHGVPKSCHGVQRPFRSRGSTRRRPFRVPSA